MLRLKQVLAELDISYRAFADLAGTSPAAISELCNHNRWPKRGRHSLRGRIVAALEKMGAEATAIASAFEVASDEAESTTDQEDLSMLLRNQRLTQEARQMFGIVGDPFGPVTSGDQVYLTNDIRYARETLYWAATNADSGTITAVVGESGSGKSTLRRDLKTRLATEGRQVVVIEPFIMGMEVNDKQGKSLKVGQIAERVIRTLAPEETVRMSQDARFDQMVRLLTNSANAGNKHVVLIEEAHSLPKATLRHLKRLVELEHGMRYLLSVVLVGQTELSQRLSETDPEIREVVQRCGICTLLPMSEAGGYLRHRLAAVGVPMERVINGAGIAALEVRLRPMVQRGRQAVQVSLLYPLAVQNLVVAACNKAAELGIELVDADVVQGV